MSRFLLTALAATLFLAGAAVSSHAAETASAVRLLAGSPGPDGKLRAGLEIALQPGWKTYWINPGPTGFAPKLDFFGSENLASAEPLWPAPVRFQDGTSSSVGYAERVIVPLRITPVHPSQPVVLRAVMDYGLCEKICLPMRDELALELLPGEQAEEAQAAEIAAFEARVPKPASMGAKGPLAVTAAVRTIAGLEVEVGFPKDAAVTDVFASATGISVGMPQKLVGGAWRIKLRSGPHPRTIDIVAVADGESIQVPLTLDDLGSRP